MTDATQYPLGRIYKPDSRDADFPFSLHLSSLRTSALPSYKYWAAGPLKLNQKRTPSCVGQTGANWLQATPIRTKISPNLGLELYLECKKIDGIPDIEGTWDRILMKILAARGVVDRYLWAQNPEELSEWVLSTGPVMIGIPWYESMFTPNSKGLITEIKDDTGAGHEILIRGYNTKTKIYTLINSWGPNWGLNGEFKMKKEHVDRLVFAENGDACAAVQK